MGGFGSAVLEAASEMGLDTSRIKRLGIPDRFIEHGERSELMADLALVVGLILGSVANVLYGSFSGNDLVWGSVGKLVFTYFVAYILSMATGFAFGALFLNSPAGIVAYFVYSFVSRGCSRSPPH